MNDYTQGALFGEVSHATSKPMGREGRQYRVLITVKAAPNPSAHYGETVCVAGIRIDDVGTREWIRLYPINFRDLDNDAKFQKYSLINITCRPAENDQRRESWRPDVSSIKVGDFLPSRSTKRRNIVEPMATDTMCGLYTAAKADPASRSLGLVQAAAVTGFEVKRHPGWSRDEQAKIDAYVNQPELFNDKRKAPQIGRAHV